MRETSLKYIAANRNIVGQVLRLPPMSQASDARALQIKNPEQIAERISRPIQSKNGQASCGCCFPIAFRVIAHVKNLVRIQMHYLYCAPKNLRIGFVRAEFAGNEDVAEIVGNAQLLKNESQPAVKI